MRDPARIDKVLAVLRAAWKASPDVRLGQLVLNATGARDFLGVYQTEDEDVLLGLAALAPAGPATPAPGMVSLPCRACEGSGLVDHDPSQQRCSACSGSGKEWHDIGDTALFPKCDQCNGEGFFVRMGRRPDVCAACCGRGRRPN